MNGNNKKMSVSEISTLLGRSKSTIRRDHEKGFLKLVKSKRGDGYMKATFAEVQKYYNGLPRR